MKENNKTKLISLCKATLLSIIFVFLTTPLIAEGSPWGKIWFSKNRKERSIFLEGFEEGYRKGNFYILDEILEPYRDKDKQVDISKLPKNIKNACRKLIDKDAFDLFDKETISDLVSYFYKDPANRYIGIGDIIEIAIDKLKGAKKEEIEKRLEYHRQAIKVLRKMEEKERESKEKK